MLEWLRRYVRSRTSYIPVERAQLMKSKLSITYAIIAWNLFGCTVYLLAKDQLPRTPIDSVDYAKMLGVRDATVIKYSGISKVDEYDIHLEESEFKEFYSKETEGEQLSQENTVVVE